MAAATRVRVSSRTISGEFSTFETVWRETPAARATSLTVGNGLGMRSSVLAPGRWADRWAKHPGRGLTAASVRVSLVLPYLIDQMTQCRRF
ncbi:hypothetical protein GCM10022288_22820 [Gryllotalpicola kribbensis]|uniref:Uncharacterized protein n=1 Tax=Gryllotalpicola kribbensis TaxID=993084 RepID=A0ABP8AVN6_9MICO